MPAVTRVAFGEIFRRGWEIVWGHKYLWLFGFLASAGNHLLGVVWRLADFERLAAPISFAQFEETLEKISQPATLVAGNAAFLAFFILIWLLNLFAEGGLIAAVKRIERSESHSFQLAIQDGARWLTMLIKVDTLVFLPLFVLTLAILGGLLAALALFGFGVFQGWELPGLLAPLMAGLLCLAPLIILLVPLSWLTTTARTLLFRQTIGAESGVRMAMRHSKKQIHANLGESLGLVVALSVIKNIGVWATAILGWGMIGSMVTVANNFGLGALAGILEWSGLALQIVLAAIWFTFISTAWTLGSRQLRIG